MLQESTAVFVHWCRLAIVVLSRTCRHDSGKHPALSEPDGAFVVHEATEDLDTSRPLPRLRAARVVARPVAHQHAVVVLAVELLVSDTKY